MMAFFPDFYPDELFYSTICRFHARSGNIDPANTADLFFSDKYDVPPDFEFLGKLKKEAFARIMEISGKSIEEVIMEHTMFSAYCRFLEKEKRLKAYTAMAEMDTKAFFQTIPINRKKGIARYACYCPLCAANDRSSYGEAYWHRAANIAGITVCAEHGCNLINSNFAIFPKQKYIFQPAEMIIPPKNEVVLCNEKESKLAAYMFEVFSAPLDFENETPIGDFLNEKLTPPFISNRHAYRHVQKIMEEVDKIAKNNEIDLSELHLQRIFEGKRTNFAEICVLAMAVGISPQELINPAISASNKRAEIEEQMILLKKKGLKNSEISHELGLSYTTVKEYFRR